MNFSVENNHRFRIEIIIDDFSAEVLLLRIKERNFLCCRVIIIRNFINFEVLPCSGIIPEITGVKIQRITSNGFPINVCESGFNRF